LISWKEEGAKNIGTFPSERFEACAKLSSVLRLSASAATKKSARHKKKEKYVVSVTNDDFSP
jgi:hypothetical protein